jgi:hypothetical protein
MRYCASEKFEIIELVQQSSLSIRRTLAPIGFRATARARCTTRCACKCAITWVTPSPPLGAGGPGTAEQPNQCVGSYRRCASKFGPTSETRTRNNRLSFLEAVADAVQRFDHVEFGVAGFEPFAQPLDVAVDLPPPVNPQWRSGTMPLVGHPR